MNSKYLHQSLIYLDKNQFEKGATQIWLLLSLRLAADVLKWGQSCHNFLTKRNAEIWEKNSLTSNFA